MNDGKKAVEYFENVFKIQKIINGENQGEMIYLLWDIAYNYKTINEYAKSIEYYEKSY